MDIVEVHRRTVEAQLAHQRVDRRCVGDVHLTVENEVEGVLDTTIVDGIEARAGRALANRPVAPSALTLLAVPKRVGAIARGHHAQHQRRVDAAGGARVVEQALRRSGRRHDRKAGRAP